MKKLLLILFCLPILGYGQINIGNDQTICLGDTAEVIALLQGGGQGAGMDTVIAGLHATNYTAANSTRGWWFQAQSSFTISGVHCSDDNTAGTQLGTNQSVEIVDFGTNPPLAYPTTTGSHTTLFSAIDVAAGWVPCNVNIVSGNYYGIIGAKHAPVVTGPIIPIPTMPKPTVPSGARRSFRSSDGRRAGCRTGSPLLENPCLSLPIWTRCPRLRPSAPRSGQD